MFNNIKDNSIIICNNNIKMNILLNNKRIKNIKFMTIKEFINNYYGTYNDNAVYYLMKKYKYNYDVALEYLNNLFYNYNVLDNLYNELKEKQLLDFNEKFKEQLREKNIYLIGYYNIDKYVLNTLNELNAIFISDKEEEYNHNIYEFRTLEDEVNYIINDIIKNHKEHLNDVYIINANSSYINTIKRLFNIYNLKINIKEKNSIYSNCEVQSFIKNLKESKNIDKCLQKISNIDIKNKIINIINKYNVLEDDIFIEILDNEIKQTYFDNVIYSNAVNMADFEDMYLDDKYYYIINFNQGSVPKVYYDDEFIKDEKRKVLGLNTSIDKLNNNKKMIISKIKNYENVFISYKLKDYYNEYLVSPLVNELNFNIIKNVEKEYIYSNKYNLIELSKMLDNYLRFNVVDKNLNDLYITYKNNDYNSYDNKFKGVDFGLLKKYLNNNLNLSYTSINNYFHCRFRFFVENILRIDSFEQTFQILIGDLFHYCLSKMYEDDFELKKVYDEYLMDKKLSNKELFFVKKLYDDLESVIDVIRSQDRHSKFNNVLTEKKISFNNNDDININFTGIIDKIKYYEKNGTIYLSLIDYKTGNNIATLDNINNGFNLQLPIYVYLIKNNEDKKTEIVGLYLQKVLNNIKINSEDIKKEKRNNLKLMGYTINDEELIELFDDTYFDSEIIHGMKKTKEGLSSYSKTFDKKDIDNLISIVEKHINEVIDNIKLGNFKINPKRMNNDLIGCKNCKYRDLCFRQEEDIDDVNYTKFEDIKIDIL